MTTNLAAIILAAGQGKRMNNPSLAKVMHPIGGIPMIEHVVGLAMTINAKPIVVIVGHAREALLAHLSQRFDSQVSTVVQAEQLGTGHAIMQAMPALKNFDGNVLVLSGDVPLLTNETIAKLLSYHAEQRAAATILTVDLPDPTGYGRIVRGPDGNVKRIIEERDASPDQKKINEINSGIYVFNWSRLQKALAELTTENSQEEYYLTDVFETFTHDLQRVAAWKTLDALEVSGVNTLAQLEELDQAYHERMKTK